jgi:hypothetical protein
MEDFRNLSTIAKKALERILANGPQLNESEALR